MPERSDPPNPSTIHAELVAFLRAIDDGLAALDRDPQARAAAASLLRATADLRGAGVMVASNSLVSIAGTLERAIELVTRDQRIPTHAEVEQVRSIAEALCGFITAMSNGGDPRPFLSMTWVTFQKLQEMTTSPSSAARFLVPEAPEPPLDDLLVVECQEHLQRIRAAAAELSLGVAPKDALQSALRALHAVKGAAAVAGFADLRESCHRSEGRIQRIAACGRSALPTLVAEVRIAADSIEELLIERMRNQADNQQNTALSVASVPIAKLAQELSTLSDLLAAYARGDSHESVGGVHKALSRARDLIGEVELRLHASTAPQRQREREPLEHLAARLRSAFRALARESGKHAGIEIQMPDMEMDSAVVGALFDPLVQLLRNALEHGIEPPEVRAAAGKPERGTVLVRVFRRGHETIVEVFDDGRGIATSEVRQRASQLGMHIADDADEQAVLQAIFAPGFSLRELPDARAGRGIGLDSVRCTLQRLGGDVIVASTPGIGACFRLSLPDVPTTTSWTRTRTSHPGATVDAAARTALVVDDSVGVRRVLGVALQRHGWRIVQARDGEEALRVLRAEMPDVVLTDLEMPVLDGYALLRAIRSEGDWANIPIIAMTARVSEARNESLLALGADACLKKPFEETDLLSALDLATARRNQAADG